MGSILGDAFSSVMGSGDDLDPNLERRRREKAQMGTGEDQPPKKAAAAKARATPSPVDTNISDADHAAARKKYLAERAAAREAGK